MSNQNQFEKTKELLNSVSPSFCSAKWLDAHLWLGTGRTASCHHPAAHNIPLDEIKNNPGALHNTKYKQLQRKKMLQGERPAECGYCWRVEDIKKDNVYSDRIYKSMNHSVTDIEKIVQTNLDTPRLLEICFDSLCNLSCSYCNSEFSTTWYNDIETNGPYKNLNTLGGQTYTHNRSEKEEGPMPYGSKNENNPYVEAFFKWYPEIKNELSELRVSGGEPSRSPWFWKLIDIVENENYKFSVNTNLIMEDDKLDRLLSVRNKFQKFAIFTSCESVGKNAEFVRSGLNYNLWKTNLKKVQYTNKNISTTIMMTISALSVWTFDEFLLEMIEMRKEARKHFGDENYYYFFSANILRFPSMQSINIIDQETKKILATKIENSLEKIKDYLDKSEYAGIQRIADYLRNVDKSYEDIDTNEEKLKDFKSFIDQYAFRKKMDIYEHMGVDFIKFYESIL